MSRNISVLNDGKKIQLNGFVRETMINVVVGLVKTLKGIDISKSITITLDAE